MCTNRAPQGNNFFTTSQSENFAPDWCFGLFKQHFHPMKIDNFDGIASAVDSSSIVSVPQLVGTLDGQCEVNTYNWSDHFDEHTIKSALKGIKQYYHFQFTSSLPSAIFVKKSSEDIEKMINLLKDHSWKPSSHELPKVVTPMRLSL